MGYIDRMRAEKNELSERVGKLLEFIRVSEKFKALTEAEKQDLEEQVGHMSQYLRVLARRLHREEEKLLSVKA